MRAAAAVMPVSGAVNLMSSREASTSGPPAMMTRKLGRKVTKVATQAPARPEAIEPPATDLATPPR